MFYTVEDSVDFLFNEDNSYLKEFEGTSDELIPILEEYIESINNLKITAIRFETAIKINSFEEWGNNQDKATQVYTENFLKKVGSTIRRFFQRIWAWIIKVIGNIRNLSKRAKTKAKETEETLRNSEEARQTPPNEEIKFTNGKADRKSGTNIKIIKIYQNIENDTFLPKVGMFIDTFINKLKDSELFKIDQTSRVIFGSEKIESSPMMRELEKMLDANKAKNEILGNLNQKPLTIEITNKGINLINKNSEIQDALYELERFVKDLESKLKRIISYNVSQTIQENEIADYLSKIGMLLTRIVSMIKIIVFDALSNAYSIVNTTNKAFKT